MVPDLKSLNFFPPQNGRKIFVFVLIKIHKCFLQTVGQLYKYNPKKAEFLSNLLPKMTHTIPTALCNTIAFGVTEFGVSC